MLKPLLQGASRSEPLVRIYPGCIVFNAPAARLLNFKEGDAVSIMQDDRDGYVYVGNCVTKQSFTLTPRKKTFKVNNSPLCKMLADCLEGFGTYRISKDMVQSDYNDNKYYNIFKKKYGN